MMFLTFYSSQNPQKMYQGLHKNIKEHNLFNIDWIIRNYNLLNPLKTQGNLPQPDINPCPKNTVFNFIIKIYLNCIVDRSCVKSACQILQDFPGLWTE